MNRPRIDTQAPHSARVWNYLLGGKDNYPVDRQIGDVIKQMFPPIAQVARRQRSFLVRSVEYLVAEAGIRQFLDIGTGLPTADNTHEVAQAFAPECRIVYVDNDPLVLVHAEALLTSAPPGVTDYIEADVRDPETILQQAARTLDFDQPIGLMMLGIMGQLPDEDDPWTLIQHYVDAMPSGSYLALSDGSDDDPTLVEAIKQYNANSASSYHLRDLQQVERFFASLELVEPGVVPTQEWRPTGSPSVSDTPEVFALCGIGRKA